MSNDAIRAGLTDTIAHLDQCIAEVERRAVDEFDGLDPHMLRDYSGAPLLAPLLIAKANALGALAHLSEPPKVVLSAMGVEHALTVHRRSRGE